MKKKITGFFVFLVFFLLFSFFAYSQEGVFNNANNNGGGGFYSLLTNGDFLLIPILETIFSGNVNWRPNWPVFLPPDAFLIENTQRQPLLIELSNETFSFTVRRDCRERLLEFPVFFLNAYANVRAVYSANGALTSMNIALNIFSYETDAEEAQFYEEQNGQTQPEIQLEITFPHNFIPFSAYSPGGSFPEIRVTAGETVFLVFIFESPRFLTETWYTSAGEMLLFSRASTNTQNGLWSISSLQMHGQFGSRYIDFFFDSVGNVTEIRYGGSIAEVYGEGVFSALYRGRRPVHWRRDIFYFDKQWDSRGILTFSRLNFDNNFEIEWRFEYEMDSFGSWIKLNEMPYIMQFNLMTPHPSFRRSAWQRRIIY